MRFRKLLLTLSLTVSINNATLASDDKNDNGLIQLESPHSVEETINRLENILKAKGMTIFKRISHSNGASMVGLKLRSSELLIFGNPKIGTPLMMCEQSAAIDLPQKALAYKDSNGQVWLAYNDPEYIQRRHNIKQCDKVVEKIEKALDRFANAAVSKN